MGPSSRAPIARYVGATLQMVKENRKRPGNMRTRRTVPPSHHVRQENPMSQGRFAACIDACNACADACDHCAAACLAEDDPKPMARCIALDMDCAAMCR